jgi:hypothetical protein
MTVQRISGLCLIAVQGFILGVGGRSSAVWVWVYPWCRRTLFSGLGVSWSCEYYARHCWNFSRFGDRVFYVSLVKGRWLISRVGCRKVCTLELKGRSHVDFSFVCGTILVYVGSHESSIRLHTTMTCSRYNKGVKLDKDMDLILKGIWKRAQKKGEISWLMENLYSLKF